MLASAATGGIGQNRPVSGRVQGMGGTGRPEQPNTLAPPRYKTSVQGLKAFTSGYTQWTDSRSGFRNN